jgi:DNA-binding MarR family transcriptional regulator
MPESPAHTARELMEVVPLVMRTLRAEMRSSRANDLSVPQFRALGFVHRKPGASLSDVAEHIGLALPSMSKLMDGLVDRKLVRRAEHIGDRRRVNLELTARGCDAWQSARASAQASIAARLAQLDEEEQATIVRAMRILLPVFAHAEPHS